MNPIEFLKQNGHDPNNFRQDIPQGPAIANHEAKYYGAFKETPRRKAVPKKGCTATSCSAIRILEFIKEYDNRTY